VRKRGDGVPSIHVKKPLIKGKSSEAFPFVLLLAGHLLASRAYHGQGANIHTRGLRAAAGTLIAVRALP